MPTAKVVPMAVHRDRRQQRFEIARALAGPWDHRRVLVEHLGEIATLSGSDRVAVVWVDEYGPGLVHPHVVVDLLQTPPRRSFRIEPLRRAWEDGIPGSHESVGHGSSEGSTWAVALGSDGARAWFVVADSVAARPALTESVRDSLMFLCGECSAIVLHRDLDASPAGGPAEEQGVGPGFAGWRVLRDIEGREGEGAEASGVAQRFAATRVVRLLLDEELVMASARLDELVAGARRELAGGALPSGEVQQWLEALDLVERGAERTGSELAALLVGLGEAAEDRGHDAGAEELYLCAFAVAAARGAHPTAVEAARSLGRLHRREARRDQSERWYRTAASVAGAIRDVGLRALSVSGLASLAQERGNLPDARDLMAEALELAVSSGEATTMATLHRACLSLEHAAGDDQAALEHGWAAVAASEAPRDRTRSLASLAGVLGEVGDVEAAADAWSVVAATTEEVYLKVFALDGLAEIHALQGDAAGYERYAALLDGLGWENMPSACSQVLFDRGLACRALGRRDEAASWLGRAVAHAEEHGFAEMLFRAEEALRTLDAHVARPVEANPAAPPAVREGVRAMRLELAGTAI